MHVHMSYIDIGSNLSNAQFSADLPDVVARAELAGVSHQVLTSTSLSSWAFNEGKVRKNPSYFSTTYGVHPHNAKNFKDFLAATNFAGSREIVRAIGEVGLDYNRMFSTKNEQMACFEYFAELAKAEKLPLFLHERDAHEEFCAVLKRFDINKKVVHCFTGSKDQAVKYLDLGCHIGVTGWITDAKRNTEVLAALQHIPLDRLMVETDCPYLAPKNMGSNTKRCEPCHLPFVVKCLAEIKGIGFDECAEKVYLNTVEFFGLNL